MCKTDYVSGRTDNGNHQLCHYRKKGISWNAFILFIFHAEYIMQIYNQLPLHNSPEGAKLNGAVINNIRNPMMQYDRVEEQLQLLMNFPNRRER